MIRRRFIELAALSAMGVSLSAHAEARKAKTHILSLSFDDGFKKSFYSVAELHEKHGMKACLNVIATGHMKSFNAEPKWAPQHILGNFDDWNALKKRGHEVMPHTWDHRDLTKLPFKEAAADIDRCLDYFTEHLEGYQDSDAVYNFAYNASTPELDEHALKRVRAVRTGGWLMFPGKKYNKIPVAEKPITLGCWGHGPDFCDAYVDSEINAFLQSDGGWLILNTHGLDKEGWGPMRTEYLDELLGRLSKVDYLDVLPTGMALKKYAEPLSPQHDE